MVCSSLVALFLWQQVTNLAAPLVASQPGMETSRYLTIRRYRVVRMAQYITGAKLPAVQDLHLYISGSVRGRPKTLSKTAVTQVIDCSLCYRMASGTRALSLGPKGFLTASTPKP